MLNGFTVKKAGLYFSKNQKGVEGKSEDGIRWTDDVQMAIRLTLNEAGTIAHRVGGNSVYVRNGKTKER